MTSYQNLANQIQAGNKAEVQKIVNQQGLWKQAAIKEMLMRARAKNLRTPTEINANKAYLTGGKYSSALNNPVSKLYASFCLTFILNSTFR